VGTWVVKNYPGSLLPGYPTGTRVPAAALHMRQHNSKLRHRI